MQCSNLKHYYFIDVSDYKDAIVQLFYYVNKNPQDNGDHEVHVAYCTQLNKVVDPVANLASLGYHDDCFAAVAAAKAIYPKADGCYHCCEACHTS